MKTYLIYSNDVFRAYGEDAFEQAKTELEAEDKTVDDDTVWKWLHGQIQFDSDDFWHELKRADDPCYWLVIGDIGTWRRRFDGGKVFGSLINAVQEMIDRMDYVTITEDRYGHVNVTCVHHDSANYFKLYRLSDRGYEWYNRNARYEDRRAVCETLEKPRYRQPARLRKALGWVA